MAAPLILASHSPRRRALLAEAGYAFEVIVATVREIEATHLSLRELTIANATRKALAVARQRPGAIVLAADTLVALEGEVIGKPRDLNHARAILRRLSGRAHEVCTGVFIAGPEFKISLADISRVRFRRLTEKAITDYFGHVNPLDKAGAYAAQGAGRNIIASVQGSFTNVIGLPMERTLEALGRFGLRPFNASRPQLRERSSKPAPARVLTPYTKTKR